MFKKHLLAVSSAVILLSVLHSAEATTRKQRGASPIPLSIYLWTGDMPFVPSVFFHPSSSDSWVGGTGNWSNPAQWSTGLPGGNSDVFINSGNDYVTLDTSADIASLTLGGSSGSSTLIDPDGNSFGINIAGSLIINQTGNLTLGNQYGGGDRVFANANSINAGNITLGNLSQIQVTGNFANSGSIFFNSLMDGGSSFGVSGDFNNSGTISDSVSAINDTFFIGGSLTNSGSFGGGFGGGPLSASVGGSVTNSGDIALASISVNGTFTNTATGGLEIILYGGSLGSLNNAGSVSVYNGGLQVNGDASNSGQITVTNEGFGQGVDMYVQGTLTNGASGSIGVGGGFSQDFSSLSTTTLNNSGSIQLLGSGTLDVYGNLTNSGVIATSVAMESQSNYLTVNGRLTNNSGGTLVLGGIGDTATITNLINLGNISIANQATLNIPTQAHATGNATGGLVNAGNIVIQQGGTLTDYLKYTQNTGQTTVDGHLGGIVNLAGGSLYGNGGTISGSITSNASINFGDSPLTVGQLTFAGNFTQGALGNLTFDIAGLNQYDKMNVTGQAHLNGGLTIDLLHGYVPQIGNLFQIMTFGSESGHFSTVVGLPINGQEHFVLDYNSTNLTLDVVSGQLDGVTSLSEPGQDEPYIAWSDSGSYKNGGLDSLPTQTAPEPGSMVLFGSGLLGVVGLINRRA